MRSPPAATGPDRDRRIYLARHGETEWNRVGRWQGATDIPLSDVGRAQARALGRSLSGRGIGRVYSSHLARARETAEIVAASWGGGLQVHVDPRLRERGYGCFEGLTREECAARHPGVWEAYQADRRLVPPDAEPAAEVIARVSAAFEAITSDLEAGARVLVISHGGTIRSFVHHAVGTLLPPMENSAVLTLGIEGDRFVLQDPLDHRT